jgi:outer membrane protease
MGAESPTGPEQALAAEVAARQAAEHELALLQQRMDNAQALANMGDYDWHIPTDTNRWSDQL